MTSHVCFPGICLLTWTVWSPLPPKRSERCVQSHLRTVYVSFISFVKSQLSNFDFPSLSIMVLVFLRLKLCKSDTQCWVYFILISRSFSRMRDAFCYVMQGFASRALSGLFVSKYVSLLNRYGQEQWDFKNRAVIDVQQHNDNGKCTQNSITSKLWVGGLHFIPDLGPFDPWSPFYAYWKTIGPREKWLKCQR